MNIFKDKNELTEALQACKSSFRSLGFFSAAINILALTPSIYMLQVYDRVLMSRNEVTLTMITLMTVGLLALAALLEMSRSFVLVRVGNKLDLKLNDRLYTASFEANLRQGNGNAGQALRDLTNVRQFLTGNGILAFFDTPWIPIYMAVIFLFHPLLGLLAVGGAVISIALTYANNRGTARPLADANRLAVRSASVADSSLKNAEVIEAMGMLGSLRKRWMKDHHQFLSFQAQASDQGAIWSHTSKYFRIFLQSAALGLGALLVIENQITPGMMIACSILMGKALQPIDMLTGVWRSFSGTKVAYERLVATLDANPVRKLGIELPTPEGRINFEAVSAGPPGIETATLININIQIQPGQALGVIGPSGAGKSTFMRLVVGVWRAQQGKVRIDGADINQYDKELLGPHIGYLPQTIELFAGTVAENIARFGEMDSDKVINAAKLAGVHEMVLQLPKGYDTMLGDQGAGLSGGQRQRLGLARALYGNPKIVVLDEPNSNLDDAGEAALIEAINHQRNLGHTVILATHKPSLLTVTNNLMYLNRGQIAAAGPTMQVLKKLQESSQQQSAQGTNSSDRADITSPVARLAQASEKTDS
ncbi:MAG: type I secretion system permease/ATPase [Limnobacter sp.]|nr:type I secretion system permease/ATPase [Limnobacter sp.]